MITDWGWRQWIGWVKVRLRGLQSEAVVAEMNSAGYKIWHMVRDAEGDVWMLLPLSAVSGLRQSAISHQVGVDVMDRGGLVFRAQKLRARPMLGVGGVGGLLAIWWMLGRIWVVAAPVSGQPPRVRQELVQAAYEAGLRPGVFAGQVNWSQVAATMEHRLHGFIWIRLSRHGVVAEIQAAKVGPRPAYRSPTRLVANQPGKILQVEVYMGDPLVAKGDRVRSGQILIQGVRSIAAVGAPSAERVVAPAIGQVWADVVHRVRLYQPLLEHRQIQEPRRFIRRQILWEDGPRWTLTLGSPRFRHYRVALQTVPVAYRGVELPVEWRQVVYNEIKEVTRRLTYQQATALGISKAERAIGSMLPQGGRWLSRKRALHATKAGVWVTLSWHAQQNIATLPSSARQDRSDNIR